MKCKEKIFTIIACLFLLPGGLLAQEINQPLSQWEQEGKQFVLLLDGNDFEAAISRMAPVMKQHFDLEKLQKLWRDLQNQMGQLQTIEKTSVEQKGQFHNVSVICQFASSKLNLLVVLDENHLVSGLWFLPAPAPEYVVPSYVDTTAFLEQEITFGLPDWKLPGVLAVPKGEAPFPAVVLVHGSGPNDRDETIGPNRPFRDLAWGLASNGILVLRYDKRTKVYGMKIAKTAITVEEEVIQDALAAIEFIRQRNEVNKDKVFLLGHSLGAMLAPEIAFRSKELAGVILMAAPARTLEALTIEQLQYLNRLNPARSNDQKQQLDSLVQELEKLQTESVPETTTVFGAPASYYYDLHKRLPFQFAEKLQIPMLFLQGERDYQVTMQDLNAWKEKLVAKQHAQFISYPDLNHLFIAGKEKSGPQEYMDQQRHVDEKVIQDISGWIKK